MNVTYTDTPILDRQGRHLRVLLVVLGVTGGADLDGCLEGLMAQVHPQLQYVYVAEADALTSASAADFRSAVVEVPDIESTGAAANARAPRWGDFDVVVFVRDNISLAPEAVAAACDAMLGSQSGIVGAKVARADDEDVLVEVGLSADRFGTPYSRLEGDELDHAQYDHVRLTLAASFNFLAVRSDVLAYLEGFDEDVVGPGTELDLCWRAIIAGEDVVYAPSVRVFELSEPPRDEQWTRRLRQNRVRLVLKNYSPARMVLVSVQGIMLAGAQSVAALLRRDWRGAREPLRPWVVNLREPRSVREARRQAQGARRVRDRSVTKLMLGASGRLHSTGSEDPQGESRLEHARRVGTETYQSYGGRWIAVFALLVLFMFIAGRNLLTGPIPAVGRLTPIGGSAFDLIGDFVSSWRSVGLGSPYPTPPGSALGGMAGVLTFGSAATAQKLLLLSGLALAGVAFARALKPTISARWVRTASAAVYVLSPLWWNALAKGDLGAILVAVFLPLIARRLAHVAGFGAYEEGDTRLVRKLELVVLVALAIAAEPAVIWAVLTIVLGWGLGSVVVGGLRRAGVTALAALQVLFVAGLLLLPWIWTMFIGDGAQQAFAAVLERHSFDELLRFNTGPYGGHWIFLGLVIGAFLPLAVTRGDRWAWATRWWTVAVLSFFLAWLVSRETLPLIGRTEILLAPAMLGVAILVGWGIEALRQNASQGGFGTLQPVWALFVVVVAVALLSPLTALPGGRFRLPDVDWAKALSWQVDQAQEEGDFLTLFVGDTIPGDSRPLAGDLQHAAVLPGGPRFEDHWLPPSSDGDVRLSSTVEALLESGDPDAGRLLAPFGIRYIAVPANSPAVADAFGEALDFKVVKAVDPDIGTVFENTAWVPTVASVDGSLPSQAVPNTDFLALEGPETTSEPWERVGRAEWQGRAIDQVYAAVTADDRFRLEVGEEVIEPTGALGWAMQFQDVETPDDADLVLQAGPRRMFALLFAGLLWLVVVAGLIGLRGRDATFP